jgi:hypothetical protein
MVVTMTVTWPSVSRAKATEERAIRGSRPVPLARQAGLAESGGVFLGVFRERTMTATRSQHGTGESEAQSVAALRWRLRHA